MDLPLGLAGATLLAAAALFGLRRNQHGHGVAGAYIAFACGVLVWGWVEVSFLMGFVTGPAPHTLPAGCRRMAALRLRDRR